MAFFVSSRFLARPSPARLIADPLLDARGEPESNYTDLSAYLLQQSGESGASKKQGQGASLRGGAGGNYSLVEQYGSYNSTAVDLQGAGNRSAQSQFGFDNTSKIGVTGANNDVGTLQIGSGNSVDVNVTGQSNTISQTQYGNNLSYSLNQVGSGKAVTVFQSGSK